MARANVKPEPNEDGEYSLVLEMHAVLIVRDPMVKIPTEIFAHELPICQLLNGEENVEIIKTFAVEVSKFTIDAEYDRLIRKYELSGTNVVIEVYGKNPRLLAEEMGLPYRVQAGARTVKKLEQSLQVDNSLEVPSGLESPNAVIGKKVRVEKAEQKAA